MVCTILSSRYGYEKGLSAASTVSPSGDETLTFDPSVLALWNGKLEPQGATLPDGQLFSTTKDAAKYAVRLLQTGAPTIEGPTKKILVQIIKGIADKGFWKDRISLKRHDGGVEESMLSYEPYHLYFGAGRGQQSPKEYFGTGWSTTL